MSTQTELTRLQTARNVLRTWLVGLGLAISTDKLDTLATTAAAIKNQGAVGATLDTATGNQSYTVPAGIHNGNGIVKITLEEKSTTPTKNAQTVTPSDGKVLSKVKVAAMPATYQDVSGVTAAATDVLDGKTIVLADGTRVKGTMQNNDDVSGTIDGLTTVNYVVPAGYTKGGTVSLTNDIETVLAAI